MSPVHSSGLTRFQSFNSIYSRFSSTIVNSLSTARYPSLLDHLAMQTHHRTIVYWKLWILGFLHFPVLWLLPINWRNLPSPYVTCPEDGGNWLIRNVGSLTTQQQATSYHNHHVHLQTFTAVRTSSFVPCNVLNFLMGICGRVISIPVSYFVGTALTFQSG